VSLVESAHRNRLGFKIELRSALRPDLFLFSETQSRVLISFKKEDVQQVLGLLKAAGLPYLFIGDVRKDQATVVYNGKTVIDTPVQPLHYAYATGLEAAVFGRK
jgi:phosphoribosylformylglycinamidine synthase